MQLIRKCQICDKTKERSINIEKDDYVYIDGKYYHTECYHIFLITKKKMSEKEAITKIQKIKQQMKLKSEQNLYRDKLTKLLLEVYSNMYVLPGYFYMKLNEINKGKYKGLKAPISNMELYEMYSNPKLINRLNKVAYKKRIKIEDRPTWDLAIVLSEYNNYKKSKKRQLINSVTDDNLKGEVKKIKKDIEKAKKNKKNNNTVDINDFIL